MFEETLIGVLERRFLLRSSYPRTPSTLFPFLSKFSSPPLPDPVGQKKGGRPIKLYSASNRSKSKHILSHTFSLFPIGPGEVRRMHDFPRAAHTSEFFRRRFEYFRCFRTHGAQPLHIEARRELPVFCRQ